MFLCPDVELRAHLSLLFKHTCNAQSSKNNINYSQKKIVNYSSSVKTVCKQYAVIMYTAYSTVQKSTTTEERPAADFFNQLQ